MERIAKPGVSPGWGLAAVVVLLALAVAFWRSPGHEKATALPSPSSRLIPDQGTGPAVSAKVEAPHGLQTHASAAAAPPAPSQQAAESRFRDQPQDAASLAAEDALLKTVIDPQLATSGITPRSPPDVSCRQVTCRITATFRSQSDAADWATLYMTLAGAELGSAVPVFVDQPDGSVEMRLYADRRPR